MSKLTKRTICFLICLVMILAQITVTAAAAEATSGTCGDNLTWELSDDGTLTISGSGVMYDYTWNTMPWYSSNSSITSVVIADGVTSIGAEAFNDCSNMGSITIPSSVTSIGDGAFFYCTSLTDLTIPDSVITIGNCAFLGCSALGTVTVPASVTVIGYQAFCECSDLTEIIFEGNAPEIGVCAFYGVTANAIYPNDDATWTEEVMQQYDGSITWVMTDPCAEGHDYGDWYSVSATEERRDCINCDHYETRPVEVVSVPEIITQPADLEIYVGETAGFFIEAEGDGLTYQWYIMRSGETEFSVWNKKTTASVSFKSAEANNGMQVYCVVTNAAGGSTTSEIATLTLKSVPFTDVSTDSDFFEAIMWAYENDITSSNNTEFNGTDVCTRRQVVLFLYRYAGEPGHSVTENPFTDVPETSIYYDAIMWAYENGITTGTTATTFSPTKTVTRAQFVTFLWRALGEPEPTTTEFPFTDVGTTSDFYKPVLWAYENGVTVGTSATTFGRNDGCTRAQVVTFMYRALGVVVE